MNYARCTQEIKSRLPYKCSFQQKDSFHRQTGIKFRKEKSKGYILSIAMYGAAIWTLRKVDQKYLKSFEMWCWRRMKKVIWTDHVRNEEVLQRVKEERKMLQTVRRKDNWIGHILRRNCFLKHVIDRKVGEKIEVKERRRRICKQQLNDFTEKRGYWKLKRKALDRVLWRTCCGRGPGPVVRQTTTERMNVCILNYCVSYLA